MTTADELARQLGADLFADQVQLLAGRAIADAAGRRPWHAGLISVDPARPSLIRGVDAGNGDAVGQFISEAWGPDTDCFALDETDQGTGFSPVTLSALSDLADAACLTLWVPAADPYENGRRPETLARIIARLRAPGGCPWDQKQTTQSMRESVLDEAYEVVDAIDAGDDPGLADELGDVLLAVYLHAQVAEDEGRFTLGDVYRAVNRKLIRRHPHVFGDVAVDSADEVVANWQAIKQAERAASGETEQPSNPLARYPASMPATQIAVQVARRAELFGSDPSGDAPIEAEDALLEAVDRLVRRGVDPNIALRAALGRRAAAAERL